MTDAAISSSPASSSPHALIFAAGQGRRLAAAHRGPKALMEFAGRSLIRRHVEALRAVGVADITVVTGFEEAALRAHIARFDARVGFIGNPDFHEGSLVSLDCAHAVLTSGRPVLLMDADVICERAVVARLLRPRDVACLLLVDRDLEPGDEPVKLCVRDGRIVDFAKLPVAPHDWHGESVGFFRLAAAAAAALAQAARAQLEAGERTLEYEPVLRDLMVARPPDWSGFEDVTGLAWTEIDFPADIERAARLLARVDGERVDA